MCFVREEPAVFFAQPGRVKSFRVEIVHSTNRGKMYLMPGKKRRQRIIPCAAAALWVACAGLQANAEEVSLGQAAYERDVLPVLRQFCADCHRRATSEGRWAFDAYQRYADALADQEAWEKVRQLVQYHIMPPHGEQAPTPGQRRAIVDWIEGSVFHVDPARPDPGHPVLRRLNRAEYNNTVRDVLGVNSQPADQFPADDAGYGFDNVGDVLSVSPLHVEKYLAAARDVAGEVTAPHAPPRVGVELKAEALTVFAGEPERRDGTLGLRSPGDRIGTTVRIPQRSVYRILIRGSSGRDQSEPTRLEVLCDEEPVAAFPAAPNSSVLAELPAGNHRIALRAPSASDDGRRSAVTADISFLAISGPFTPMPPRVSEFLSRNAGSRPMVPPILRLSGEELGQGSGRSSLDTGRAWFSSNGYRHTPLKLPASGEYRVRFKVGAQQVGDEPVRFEARVGEETLGPFSVTAGSQAEQWIETRCKLPAGEHDWQVWFVNEYKDPASGAERWFWLHEFTIEGPLHDRYGLSRDETTRLLIETARRLFRRSLNEAEEQKLQRLVETVLASGEPTRTALRIGLEALLVSPKFLYHPRPEPAGDQRDGTAQIDEPALASRLSYFLWSSAPDEQLLRLGERGRLRRQLPAQVKRMIHDGRSEALTANFAGQWLQLRNLEHAAPDPAAFPEFDAHLAADMRRETELVFEHILHANRPVLDFLNADYTFINERLARHYGLTAPAGEGFQRVSLAGTPRRGVVTHAGILTITSLPTRTSPVRRGKWLLEQLLGVEPPPPPADIPPLPAGKASDQLTLRARLEQHRTDPSCASCHALLDPPGLALENFDAVGRWRARDAGREIDASGRLITGERFADWSELRAELERSQRENFVRCFVEQLLTYALGRGLTYRDKPAVEEILRRGEASNYGFQDLILAVCESVPFQRMRIAEQLSP